MFNNYFEKNTMSFHDKRIFPRWRDEKPVTCKTEYSDDLWEGKIKDISSSGISVSVNKRFKLDDEVHFKVKISKDENLDILGRIVWIRSNADFTGNFRMGVQFSDINIKTQEQLLKYILDFNIDEFSDFSD